MLVAYKYPIRRFSSGFLGPQQQEFQGTPTDYLVQLLQTEVSSAQPDAHGMLDVNLCGLLGVPNYLVPHD